MGRVPSARCTHRSDGCHNPSPPAHRIYAFFHGAALLAAAEACMLPVTGELAHAISFRLARGAAARGCPWNWARLLRRLCRGDTDRRQIRRDGLPVRPARHAHNARGADPRVVAVSSCIAVMKGVPASSPDCASAKSGISGSAQRIVHSASEIGSGPSPDFALRLIRASPRLLSPTRPSPQHKTRRSVPPQWPRGCPP
jgi:hypothetical protein